MFWYTFPDQKPKAGTHS